MNKLTEQQIAEICEAASTAKFIVTRTEPENGAERSIVLLADNIGKMAAVLRDAYAEMEGWEPADAPELDLNEGLKRMYLEAEAELQSLRDQLRWRTPSADGVWEELPEPMTQVDITARHQDSIGVEIAEFVRFNQTDAQWFDEDAEAILHDVLAWRPRPAPYTPPTEGENKDGL